MILMTKPLALIVGVGDGLSASLARLFCSQGYRIALAARNTAKLDALAKETEATLHRCDASEPAQVTQAIFGDRGPFPRRCLQSFSPPARAADRPGSRSRSGRDRGDGVWRFSRWSGSNASYVAAGLCTDGARGTILFTGASAGVKGFPQSAPFAMGKFAQRGLAQSMARELHPQGIHVAWINIDGGIRNPGRTEPADKPDSMLDPDAIALSYLSLVQQHRSAWSNELEVRPWVEKF